MSNEAQVIVAFFVGVLATLFCIFLLEKWELKKQRKKRKYPNATIKPIHSLKK